MTNFLDIKERPPSSADVEAVRRQLGREPRDIVAIAHRCPCGQPDVVVTAPRLSGGTPFPTTFYATCPRLTGAISTLESSGLMGDMSARLHEDSELAQAYRRAHRDYLARRAVLGEVPEIAGISAGGMPDRVKCLHVLIAHSLASGPGVNPLGDEALAALPRWWEAAPCANRVNRTNSINTAQGAHGGVRAERDSSGAAGTPDGIDAVAQRNELA